MQLWKFLYFYTAGGFLTFRCYKILHKDIHYFYHFYLMLNWTKNSTYNPKSQKIGSVVHLHSFFLLFFWLDEHGWSFVPWNYSLITCSENHALEFQSFIGVSAICFRISLFFYLANNDQASLPAKRHSHWWSRLAIRGCVCGSTI